MKNLLIIFLLISVFANAQTVDETNKRISSRTMGKQDYAFNRDSLQRMQVWQNRLVFMASDSIPFDNRFGYFIYDTAATGIDTVDLTSIRPNSRIGFSTGRWVKVGIRKKTWPGGTMEINGNEGTYKTTAVTDANSYITLKLTQDTTVNGIALFKSIDNIICTPDVAASGVADAVQWAPRYKSDNALYLKTPSFLFYRPNAIGITLASLPITNLLPVAGTGAGVTIKVIVYGKLK